MQITFDDFHFILISLIHFITKEIYISELKAKLDFLGNNNKIINIYSKSQLCSRNLNISPGAAMILILETNLTNEIVF